MIKWTFFVGVRTYAYTHIYMCVCIYIVFRRLSPSYSAYFVSTACNETLFYKELKYNVPSLFILCLPLCYSLFQICPRHSIE